MIVTLEGEEIAQALGKFAIAKVRGHGNYTVTIKNISLNWIKSEGQPDNAELVSIDVRLEPADR